MKALAKKDKQQGKLLMERIDKRNAEALNWLRYVLNPDTTMPTVSNWTAVMVFAEKQALIGVCLPGKRPDNLPKGLLLQWIAHVQQIEQRNKQLNNRVEQLFEMLEKDGFQCCLLKGQGNAFLYDVRSKREEGRSMALLRQPGDIDVWLNTDEETAYQYVKEMFPDEKESYKHIHFPIFDDVPVDVHVTPLKFYSGLYRKKLEQWIVQNKAEQFGHTIQLTETDQGISVPTYRFNAVYQLGHMLIHLFDEGLGLRQVVDYYYVLNGLEASDEELQDLAATIKNLGMLRFAKAMMWVETSVLGLPVERCIVEPDQRRGKQLLADILEGGNFGHHSQRYNGKTGFYYRGMVEARRNMKLLQMAPREGIARLLSKIGTAVKHTITSDLSCQY